MHIKKHLQIIIILLSFISQSCKQHKLGMDSRGPDSVREYYGDLVQPPQAGTKPLVSFDYAIKYLLRGKEDYEILESFISAILTHYNEPAITIEALIESETNRSNKDDKHALMDMLVKDKNDNRYIVEIERNTKSSCFHKAVYTASRTIIDELPAGVDYTNIKKVYHINLLCFNPTLNQDITPLCMGKTVFKNIHHMEIDIMLRIGKDKKGNPVMVNASSIPPEYFILSIPSFDSNKTPTDVLEDWFYILKNDTFPKETHLPISCKEKIENKLMYLKMAPEEQRSYQGYIDSQRKKLIELNKYKEEGREEEREKNQVEREVERQKFEEEREVERQKFEEEREVERQKFEEEREVERQKFEEERELERQKFKVERELERQRVEEKNRKKTIKLISKLLNQGHADSSIKEMINSDEEYADSYLDNMINYAKEEIQQPADKKIRHG